MINNVANLLKGIMDEESKKLGEYALKHGPTIGKMYEGLTSNILEKSIPKELNLQFVTGVIDNGLGDMSGEIDCMLVKGNGEKIPYTSSYKWHIKDVIAVIEVKKTLYKNDLIDSFSHLRGVLHNYISYIESNTDDEVFDISSSLKAFSQTTGIVAPSYKESKKLPIEQQMFYHTLITEQLSPIRIAIGYHGYKSEKSFRDSMVKFLDENVASSGFGVNSFPQLMISGEYSFIKMNGQPYTAPMQTEYWDFLVSSHVNPILLILEFIWTRLSKENNFDNLWGEDLVTENFSIFLSGKIIKSKEQYGWVYNFTNIEDKELSSVPSTREWEPQYVTKNQFMIFNLLCNGSIERIDNLELLKFLQEEGEDPSDFFNSLVRTGLIAIKNKELQLTTKQCQCVYLPNGKMAVADNNSGRFTNWINRNIIDK